MNDSAKVRVEFWMADRMGWDNPGPVTFEEAILTGESLRALLNRLAEKNSRFPEAVFDPATQALSSEVSLILNEHVNLPQGLDTLLHDGDRLLFLPILAGG
jgi:molybdopterin converting factor small subunit